MPGWISEMVEQSASFMPHGHCYLWIPSLLWMHVASDALIGLSYLGISFILCLLLRSIRLPFTPMVVAFGLFIGLCGITHFMSIWTVWNPDYLVDGVIKVATAAASVITAIGLMYLQPQIRETVAAARLSEVRRIELEAAHASLEALYRKVTEMDQMKTQFFTNISHELRTPLALIVGPVERMREDANLTADQHRALDSIRRNANSLQRQVNDLLDISKLEAGQLQPHYARLDMPEWIAPIASEFDVAGQQRGLRLHSRVEQGLVADVDPDMLERILINLLSNAYKFTPAGGTVTLDLSSDGEQMLLTVSDTGPGISEADREHIFERFRQADGSITRKHGGSGLGLAIVRDLVQLHGGAVTAGAAPGGGACFTVRLPRRAGEAVRVDTKAPESGPAARLALESTLAMLSTVAPVERVMPHLPDRPTVLVVEDNPEMRSFIVDTLGGSYNVSTAADGEQGLERAQVLRPDLIVTDVMMPRMSGDQLMMALRKVTALAAVPVLLVSAKSDDALRVGLLQNGAQDYLIKPFLPRELLARVANLVSAKRTGDKLRGALASASSDVEGLASELIAKNRQLLSALDAADVAREQAERASAVKSLFLGMVSHELRTPIATIDMNVQLLERSRDSNLPDVHWRRVERLSRATRQISTLVESLLEYARVQSGEISAHLEELDIVAIVSEVVGAHADQARTGVALAFDGLPAQAPGFFSDGRLVRVVLANLISNALKFTTAGSVTVRLAREAGWHVVAVSDTGAGIEEADLQRIFLPFEQLSPVHRKSLPGVGLGLALVDQIVRTLGGTVEVSSKRGHGSTFSVRLPCHSPEVSLQPS